MSENNESPPGDCDKQTIINYHLTSACQKTTNPRQGIATFSRRNSSRSSAILVRKQRIPVRGLRRLETADILTSLHTSENNESPSGDCDEVRNSAACRLAAVRKQRIPVRGLRHKVLLKRTLSAVVRKQRIPVRGLRLGELLRTGWRTAVRKQRIPVRGLRPLRLRRVART